MLSSGLEQLNGIELKGSYIRVQVAKENFLLKLQSERSQPEKSKKSATKHVQQQSTAAQAAEHYDPMQMFKLGKSKKNFDDPRVEEAVEEESEEAMIETPVGVQKKLEKFNHMWDDLDTAQVTTETKPPPTTVPKKVETEAVDAETSKKRELDNRKRIQSLQQRNEALKAQHSAVKSALSRTDKQNNRKIVFNVDDDDDGGDADDVADVAPVTLTEKKKKPKTKTETKSSKRGMQLFDDEDMHQQDNQIDSQQFNLRPHLDGKTGQEVFFLGLLTKIVVFVVVTSSSSSC